MKRHEWWRIQYGSDPYMAHLNPAQIRTRFEHVLGNTCTVTEDLKLALLSSAMKGPEATDFWGIAFTHLLEEFGARDSGIPSDWNKSLYDCLNWPNLRSAVAPFRLSKQAYPQVLVKYGMVPHLREALQSGRLRVGPASGYNDPSLNRAVRDDELELTVYRRSKLHSLLIDRHGRALRPAGPAFGIKSDVLRAPTNYYVYCMSMQRSFRMFGDFESDGALIIHDIRTFVRLLGERVRSQLGRGWTWMARPVKYIDPLRPGRGSLDVVECKHFSFTYQHEYRVVWLPDQPVSKLEPLFIELGSLQHCGRLVELVP